MEVLIVTMMGIIIGALAYMFMKMSKDGQSGSDISELELSFRDSLGQLSSQIKETITEEKTARDATATMLRQQMLALTSDVGDVRAALSNNQKRGQFGEKMLEDLLRKAGLQEGIQYYKQPTIDGGRRPDFAILLSADTQDKQMTLNVDCKFPLDNYVKFINADNESVEKKAREDFVRDTRTQITQVGSRGYNAGDDNLDFVVLFFPNESIYSAAIEFNPNIIDEALDKKVVLASPNTMYGILLIVQQSARQMQLQKSANEVFPLIENLEKQASKYFAQIDKVAGNLKTLTTSFDAVTGTRKNQLERSFRSIADYNKRNTIETTGTLGELDIQDFGDNEYQDDSLTLVNN
jgi:DNA recombination protein RmuC|tara:strand:+ start:802 stop:1851 length:1050 start_codon:yes stop_codon:yes gene_type:complete